MAVVASAIVAFGACIDRANEQLGNIEGAHRVHGWSVPLQVVNTTLGFSMAVLNSIGEPKPYVHDLVSRALARSGVWEFADVAEIARGAAGRDTRCGVGCWPTEHLQVGSACTRSRALCHKLAR